jgi:hypothetical protein
LQERATSSSWQAAFNAINILCGVGLLTTPYAMAISGLSSLLLLIGIGTDVMRNLFLSSSCYACAAAALSQ